MAQKKKTVSSDMHGAQEISGTQETQLQVFDRASKLFRVQKFGEARELFLLAAAGSLREVSHNARLHISMCDRRLGKPEVQLTTLEEFYNVGVVRMNARDLAGARDYLGRAAELSRSDGARADHVFYALAACQALGGDSRGAYENLKRAIEIEPRNRNAARQDPDFSGSAQAALRPLLYPDKSAPF